MSLSVMITAVFPPGPNPSTQPETVRLGQYNTGLSGPDTLLDWYRISGWLFMPDNRILWLKIKTCHKFFNYNTIVGSRHYFFCIWHSSSRAQLLTFIAMTRFGPRIEPITSPTPSEWVTYYDDVGLDLLSFIPKSCLPWDL